MLNILVASGTANTGSMVVAVLSASGKANVRAMCRNPDSDAAKALAALPNVTVVKGDFEDPPSLKAALEGGIDRAMLVSGAGDEKQYDREVAFLAAAAEADIEATVRISTAKPIISLESTGVYAKAHARIEQYIADHKCRCIDLRPNWFMSNWLWSVGEIKSTGRISFPVADSKRKFAMIDPRDIADAAAAVLLCSKEKLQEFLAEGAVCLNGPALVDFDDLAAELGKAIGKPDFGINKISPEAFTAAMTPGVGPLMAQSFTDTVLVCCGAKEPPRPFDEENNALIKSVWSPKYDIAAFCKDNAALFM